MDVARNAASSVLDAIITTISVLVNFPDIMFHNDAIQAGFWSVRHLLEDILVFVVDCLTLAAYVLIVFLTWMAALILAGVALCVVFELLIDGFLVIFNHEKYLECLRRRTRKMREALGEEDPISNQRPNPNTDLESNSDCEGVYSPSVMARSGAYDPDYTPEQLSIPSDKSPLSPCYGPGPQSSSTYWPHDSSSVRSQHLFQSKSVMIPTKTETAPMPTISITHVTNETDQTIIPFTPSSASDRFAPPSGLDTAGTVAFPLAPPSPYYHVAGIEAVAGLRNQMKASRGSRSLPYHHAGSHPAAYIFVNDDDDVIVFRGRFMEDFSTVNPWV